ncbi:MAG: hypothetical protein LBV06_01025 [Propionibacteriaceae bacterium]|jgi:hypothetical protein|nr:hypothetical protein [Propionibacteriaceae bacterium]
MDGPRQTADEATELQAWHVRLDDAIAACMTRKGFRYVPSPAEEDGDNHGVGEFLRWLPVPNLDADRAVVARNGYGLMAAPKESITGKPANDDPNRDYLNSLSPAEQDAYSIALRGDYHVPTNKGSCTLDAIEAFPKPTRFSDRVDAFDAETSGVISSMSALVNVDLLSGPQVASLNRDWVNCMKSSGQTLPDWAGEEGPRVAMGIAMRTRPDGSLGPERPNTWVGEIPPEEISLMGTQPERDIALADYDCRASLNYLPRLTAIRVAMDEKFIHEHQAALDRLEQTEQDGVPA